MSSGPLVSIVTPSYNQGEFIEDALRSVAAQTYDNVEHVVVDGGSTDETVAVLESFESETDLRWVSEPDEGQSDAVNKGFDMANGDIVGWLNADDVYFGSRAIATVVEAFADNPDADIVYGDDAFIDRTGKLLRARKLYDWRDDRVRRWGWWGWTPASEATFYAAEVVDADRLDSDLEYVPDLEYFLRLGERYNFHHVDEILAGKRKHDETKSSNHDMVSSEARDVLTAYGVDFDLPGRARMAATLLRIQLQWVAGVPLLLDARRTAFAFDGRAGSPLASLLTQLPSPRHHGKRTVFNS